jgi:hypothetical protein
MHQNGKVRVSLHAHAQDQVEISFIGTAEGQRGKGYANAAMNLICTAADRFGVTLVLGIADDADGERGSLTVEQLHDWYETFGFEGGMRMVRTPVD